MRRKRERLLNSWLLHTVYMITWYFHIITICYARHNISSFPLLFRLSACLFAFMYAVIDDVRETSKLIFCTSFALISTVFHCAFSTALGFDLPFSCPHLCAASDPAPLLLPVVIAFARMLTTTTTDVLTYFALTCEKNNIHLQIHCLLFDILSNMRWNVRLMRFSQKLGREMKAKHVERNLASLHLLCVCAYAIKS